MFKFEDNIGLLVLKMIAPQDDRWGIDGTGTRDELDPKLRWKSYNPNMDLELTPQRNWPQCGTPMVIKTLHSSSCKNV